MTRDVVVALLGRMRIGHTSGPAGIEIARSGMVSNIAPRGPDRWFRSDNGLSLTQRWRIESGGGIAGNSDRWWLHCIGRTRDVLGPFRTQRALETALRSWRRWELP